MATAYWGIYEAMLQLLQQGLLHNEAAAGYTQHTLTATLTCSSYSNTVLCKTCIAGQRNLDIRDFAFFVFERTKHQPRRHLCSYLVLQRLSSKAALSPGIDAFWY